MLKIEALLNHMPRRPIYSPHSHFDRLPTPTDSSPTWSTASTPGLSSNTIMAPTSAPVARTRTLKKFEMTRAPAKEPVDFAPYECTESHALLSREARLKLHEKHVQHNVLPRGGPEGLIGDYVKSLPYSSDKKNLGGKTGRTRFELFKYTFTMPGSDTEHLVLWDYQVGLVRITPFFKALGHAKTAPNKALKTNRGLFELSYSITGGCIDAQGYWIPFNCAYSLCANFCYSIRWVLTPLFGTEFLDDCLTPDHPNYGTFTVSPEAIRVCNLQANTSPELSYSRFGTPISNADPFRQSEPPGSAVTSIPARKCLPGRKSRPSGSFYMDPESPASSTYDDSPPVSPKSTSPPVRTVIGSGKCPPSLSLPRLRVPVDASGALPSPVTMSHERSMASISPSYMMLPSNNSLYIATSSKRQTKRARAVAPLVRGVIPTSSPAQSLDFNQALKAYRSKPQASISDDVATDEYESQAGDDSGLGFTPSKRMRYRNTAFTTMAHESARFRPAHVGTESREPAEIEAAYAMLALATGF